MNDYLDSDHWTNGGEHDSLLQIEKAFSEMELAFQKMKQERDKALAMLERERSISLKIALNADRMHMQLQAIREAALEELCGLTADGPDNLDGLEERE